MRRLVVISGKLKIIATFAAAVLALTSIHLAAKAHIANLKREQEQLERLAINQSSTLSQNAQVAASRSAIQLPANAAGVDQKVAAPKTKPNETSTAAPAIEAPVSGIFCVIDDHKIAVRTWRAARSHGNGICLQHMATVDDRELTVRKC